MCTVQSTSLWNYHDATTSFVINVFLKISYFSRCVVPFSRKKKVEFSKSSLYNLFLSIQSQAIVFFLSRPRWLQFISPRPIVRSIKIILVQLSTMFLINLNCITFRFNLSCVYLESPSRSFFILLFNSLYHRYMLRDIREIFFFKDVDLTEVSLFKIPMSCGGGRVQARAKGRQFAWRRLFQSRCQPSRLFHPATHPISSTRPS